MPAKLDFWCVEDAHCYACRGNPLFLFGLVAVLTPRGLQAALTVSRAVNGNVFAAYLDQVLGPTLVPGDVVVPDNLPAHKVAGLADFNPIELAFSKLKAWLHTVRARTREAQEAVIQDASNWVTERAAKNWFDHCGYHVH